MRIVHHLVIGLVLAAASGLANASDKNVDIVPKYSPRQQSDFERAAPRIERGQLVNPAPTVRREPMPVERVAKRILDAPLRPDLMQGPDGSYVGGIRYKRDTR